MIGVIREQLLSTDKENKVLYNKILILDDMAGFYDVNKVLKLYNTMTNLLSKADIDKEILNKLVEINHYMNMIPTLKIEDYTGLEHNLDMYQKLHDEMFEKWDSHIIDNSNIFNYDIYDIESIDENEFDAIYENLNNEQVHDMEDKNRILGCADDEYYYTLLCDDIYKKHYHHMYMFIENRENNLEYDIANTFKYFISQVRKVELRYHREYLLIEMSVYGLHIDHIHAINQLLMAYNYLINSSSFNEGQLFEFDKYSIERYISTAKAIIERVPGLLKARLNTK